MDLFDEFANISEPTEADLGGSATREKQTRKLRRSCELCRNSKGRCCPGKEDSRCQRCAKEGKQCIFLEAKPRPKRAKNSRTRVAEMEEKLDGIFALLSNGQVAKDVQRPSIPSDVSPPETIHTNISDSSSSRYSPPQAEIAKPLQYYASYPFPDLFGDLQDVISKNVVSFEFAEGAVKYFRTKTQKFPFVLLPAQMSLDTLRREKPFLLLAILCLATSSQQKLQSQLELELKDTLSKKIIIEGEQSLDILQGLLVYLNWHHLYFKPDRQQVYQLTQMAISMVIDLGINKPKKEEAPSSNLGLLTSAPMTFMPKKSSKDLDFMRAFLGSYYVCSSICRSLRRPTNLKYSNYMEKCCQILTQTAEYETDRFLIYFIRLQQFSEEVNHAFDYDECFEQLPLEVVHIELLAKAFTQQLKQMETDFPPEIWSNPSITLSYLSLRVYVNEIGLHAEAPSPLSSKPGQSALRTWYFSPVRNDYLLRCLQAAKDYIDRVLSYPSTEMLDFDFPDFVRLVYAIFVLGCFATPDSSPVSDLAHLHEAANLDYYLDRMIAKTGELLPTVKPDDENEYIYYINQLFRQSKIWYHQVVSDFSAGRATLARTEFSFMDIIPTVLSRCLDFGGIAAQQGTDAWVDMLNTWSPGLDSAGISKNSGIDSTTE